MKLYLTILITGIVAVFAIAQQNDTIKTESGLKYIVLEKGSGAKADTGKEATVHYTGYLPDGKEFDSSIKRNQPFSFTIGEGKVIKGWDEGVALMKVGDKFRFIIPPQLGYGENGAGNIIPPNTSLIFDVQLLNVADPKLALGDTLLVTIFESGIDSALSQYHYLKNTKPDEYDFREAQLNMLGYILLRNKMIKEAIEIFKLNSEVYPESANVYDSLGEGYIANGNVTLAIENYKKSLELNPDNENAKEMLKKLDGK
jgi:FKBP-type peptidyl-prolyl cis-trans isomerase/Tetratricopeptide repeat